MARLFYRPRSPFIYIEYKTATGEVRRESTKLRRDSRDGVRAANRLLNQRNQQEKSYRTLPANSAFDRWVLPFLRQHATNPATYRQYVVRWNNLSNYWRKAGVAVPCQLTYAHCQDYVTHRTTVDEVTQNTARDDLSTMRLIMNEAIRRDFCVANPCTQLRIKTVPRREKPEITDKQAASIRAELKHGERIKGCPWPFWMRVQFEIAWHTGRRISETKMAMATIDLTRRTYTVRVKGGQIKTKPFHRGLLPILKQIKGEWTHSIGPSHSTRMWRQLFDKLGMTEHTFHCCRISLISRLRRSGVDRWTAQQICDHASATIHNHYNRYPEADLRAALKKVEFPKSDAGSSKRPR